MATEIELGPPLPELARAARVAYLDGTGRRARPVDEAVAVAARIEVVDVNGKTRTRDVSPAEARTYLTSVEGLRTRVAQARVDRAEVDADDAARVPVRADVQQTMMSTCPHCSDRRRHAGRVMFLASPYPAGIDVQHGIGWSAGAEVYEEYLCPTCGSVELFRPRPLTHPAGPPAG